MTGFTPGQIERGADDAAHTLHRCRPAGGGRRPGRPDREHPLAARDRGDWSRGVPPSHARELAAYWAGGFDWSAQQAFLNSFPQFTTTVDGQTIHFVHVRSAEAGAMPLVLLHGYPSSFVEFTRMIGPLVDPRRARRSRRGRVPRGHPLDPRVRVLHAAGIAGLGRRADGPGLRRDHGRRWATTGTGSRAATWEPGSPSSCASMPASASPRRSSSRIRGRSRPSTTRRPTT